MNVYVKSRKDMVEYNHNVVHSRPYIILSIRDVNQDPPSFRFRDAQCKGVCLLSFDDVEKGEIDCIRDADAKRIALKVKRAIKNNIDIFVHCGGGISRSAGVAGAILKFYKNDDSQIFDNPKYTPNMTVYKMVLEKLMDRSLSIEEIDEMNKKEENNCDLWRAANNL